MRIQDIFNSSINKIKDNKLKWLFLIVVIVGAWITLSIILKDSSSQSLTVKISRESISEIVEVSGQVEAAESADVSFEKSGAISNINVKVSQTVKEGEVLATISSPDSQASIREAQAAVEVARANLESVKSGYTEEEINIRRQALDNAEKDKITVANQVEDTVRNAESIIKDIFDFKFTNIFYKENNQYKLSFSTCDQAAGSALEQSRSEFDIFSVKDLNSAKDTLDRVNAFVGRVNDLLSLPCVSSDTSLTDKRTTLATVKASIQTLYTDISAKRTLTQNSSNAILNAQRNLDLVLAGGDKNKVNSSMAQLSQAQARLESAYAQASKNVIRAPFSGVVSAVNIEKGELVSAAKPAISLISDSQYQIKAKIAEADIAKMNLGSKATVTIDAYPGEVFYATVTGIDPASTDEGGVPRYGITLTFIENYPKLKIGMTANADIETLTKSGALVVPTAYIEIKTGGAIIKVKTANNPDGEERIVQVGIRSSDGMVEILRGASEGEELVQIAEDGTIKR